jgi:hypothetical protein
MARLVILCGYGKPVSENLTLQFEALKELNRYFAALVDAKASEISQDSGSGPSSPSVHRLVL